jgi:hypothetical protein
MARRAQIDEVESEHWRIVLLNRRTWRSVMAIVVIGRRAIVTKFGWCRHEHHLIAVYKRVFYEIIVVNARLYFYHSIF